MSNVAECLNFLPNLKETQFEQWAMQLVLIFSMLLEFFLHWFSNGCTFSLWHTPRSSPWV